MRARLSKLLDLEVRLVDHLALALPDARRPCDLRRLDEVEAHGIHGVVDLGLVVGLSQRGEIAMVQLVDDGVGDAQRVVAHALQVNVVLLKIEDPARGDDEEALADLVADRGVDAADRFLVDALRRAVRGG